MSADVKIIPENLRALYANAIDWRHQFGSRNFAGAGTIELLIERIASLDVDNTALKLQVGELNVELLKLEADRDLWQRKCKLMARPVTNEECTRYGEIANPDEEGSPYIFNAGDFDAILAARLALPAQGGTGEKV